MVFKKLRRFLNTTLKNNDETTMRLALPKMAVECKSGERGSSSWATYFRERTSIPEFYQVHRGLRDTGDAKKEVRILPFSTFCTEIIPLILP